MDPNKTSQAQQPVNSTPPSVNNSSGSKLIPIILGVAAVVIIAIGAYTLGAKQSQPVVQNSIQTTPIPSPTPIDETANWKTYTNTKYGFLIKYPMSWSYLEVPNTTYKTTTDQVWFSNDGKWPMPQTDSKATITIELTKNNPSVGWSEEFFTDYKKERTILDNISAERISGTHKEIGAKRVIVFADIGDYYLVAQPASFDEISLVEFDQILSTFRFTSS